MSKRKREYYGEERNPKRIKTTFDIRDHIMKLLSKNQKLKFVGFINPIKRLEAYLKKDKVSKEDVFHESALESKEYITKLKNVLKNLKVKDLVYIRDQIWDEKRPTLKKYLVEFVFAKLFGLELDISKRELERTNIEENGNQKIFVTLFEKECLILLLQRIPDPTPFRHLKHLKLYKNSGSYFIGQYNHRKFKEIDIPEEIVIHILEYAEKTPMFLNSTSLVNSKFYLMVLKSWRIIKINESNIRKIPLLVLYNVTVAKIDINKLLYKVDIEYIQNNLKSLKKLIISGYVEKFFNSIKRCQNFSNVEALIFDRSCNYYTWNNNRLNSKRVIDIPDKFPKLKNIIIPVFNIPIKEKDLYKNLKYIRITASFTKNDVVMSDRILETFPSWFLHGLYGILFDIKLCELGYQVLSQGRELTRLALKICDDFDIINLNHYVYPHLLELNDLKLNFFKHNINENYFRRILYLKKLKLIILEFQLRMVVDINQLKLESLNFLNSLKQLERIVIHIKIKWIPIEGEGRKRRIVDFFVDLFKNKIKFKHLDKLRIIYKNKDVSMKVRKRLKEIKPVFSVHEFLQVTNVLPFENC